MSRDSVDLQSLAGRVVFLRRDPDPVRGSSSYVLVTQSARQSEDLYVVIDRQPAATQHLSFCQPQRLDTFLKVKTEFYNYRVQCDIYSSGYNCWEFKSTLLTFWEDYESEGTVLPLITQRLT